MTWNQIKPIALEIYKNVSTENLFRKDEAYLTQAFEEIEKLWNVQFTQMNAVKYILFSEAPLWQDKRNYFYNQEARLTQFLYKNDVAIPLGRDIKDKEELLEVMREIGFLILDCTPLALAEEFTSITYQSISRKAYNLIMRTMIHEFLAVKLQAVLSKSSTDVKLLFRYKRVQEALQDLISVELEMLGIKQPAFVNIGQQGGGVDRTVMKNILNHGN